MKSIQLQTIYCAVNFHSLPVVYQHILPPEQPVLVGLSGNSGPVVGYRFTRRFTR